MAASGPRREFPSGAGQKAPSPHLPTSRPTSLARLVQSQASRISQFRGRCQNFHSESPQVLMPLLNLSNSHRHVDLYILTLQQLPPIGVEIQLEAILENLLA